MNFSMDSAPHDPLQRIAYLSDRKREFEAVLEREYQLAYFEARWTGRLEAAVALGLHSKKRILQWTRRENNLRGRMLRWNDGQDPTSTAYEG